MRAVFIENSREIFDAFVDLPATVKTNKKLSHDSGHNSFSRLSSYCLYSLLLELNQARSNGRCVTCLTLANLICLDIINNVGFVPTCIVLSESSKISTGAAAVFIDKPPSRHMLDELWNHSMT
jgi:hypothetical protein